MSHGTLDVTGRCLPATGYLIRCVELAPGARLRVVLPAADAVA